MKERASASPIIASPNPLSILLSSPVVVQTPGAASCSTISLYTEVVHPLARLSISCELLLLYLLQQIDNFDNSADANRGFDNSHGVDGIAVAFDSVDDYPGAQTQNQQV